MKVRNCDIYTGWFLQCVARTLMNVNVETTVYKNDTKLSYIFYYSAVHTCIPSAKRMHHNNDNDNPPNAAHTQPATCLEKIFFPLWEIMPCNATMLTSNNDSHVNMSTSCSALMYTCTVHTETKNTYVPQPVQHTLFLSNLAV